MKEMVSSLLSQLIDIFRKFGNSWYETFQKSEIGGKFFLLIGTLIISCCLCMVPLAMIGGNTPTPEPGAISTDNIGQNNEQTERLRSSETIPLEFEDSSQGEVTTSLTDERDIVKCCGSTLNQRRLPEPLKQPA